MMSDMPQTPYDLRPVKVGTAIVEGRPISWDGQGEEMTPNKYMTTCPQCSQMITFTPSDLFTAVDGSIDNLVCGECRVGADLAPSFDEAVDKITLDKSPFVDPIESKLVNTTNLDLAATQQFKVSE